MMDSIAVGTEPSCPGSVRPCAIALSVGEPGRVIHEHARIRGAKYGERHLVGDGEDGVLEELESDGVHWLIIAGRRAHGRPALTLFLARLGPGIRPCGI